MKTILVIQLLIQIKLLFQFTLGDVTCYCDNKDTSGADHRMCINNRCNVTQSGECYVAKETPNGIIERGCTHFFTCRGFEVTERETGIRKVFCCYSNICNEHINQANLTYIVTKKKAGSDKLVLLTVLPLSLGIIVAVVLALNHVRKRKTDADSSLLANLFNPLDDQDSRSVDITNLNLLEFSTSGRGCGLPLLVQKTIASEINLGETIGSGTFGVVHHGIWRGQDVAVKVFLTSEEASWEREVGIYQTNMLRHENILGFIASDSRDTGACTQLWLICDYHSNGSLYDFLQKNPVSITTLLHMVKGMVDGLWHLHSAIYGTQGKPAVAHRDLKTKNILVKKDNTCCIADLGLAVVLSKNESRIDMSASVRAGTTRYQSPEILSNKLKREYFTTYKRADIYALGLCMWEVCTRTNVDGQVMPYGLPYHDCVPPNPSAEQMYQSVCVKKARPKFPEYWHSNKDMKVLMKVMKECWYEEPASRLTALRIKKNLCDYTGADNK